MSFLTDGFQTLVAFAAIPDVRVREKEVQPMGLDLRGEIDTTTMHNTRFRTKAAKSLIDLTEIVMQVQYDPDTYDLIIAGMGKNDLVYVRFPDGSTVAVYGFVDKFIPSSLKEGEFPLAELRVCITNEDENGEEVGPEYFDPPGGVDEEDIPEVTVAGNGSSNSDAAELLKELLKEPNDAESR